MKPLAAQTISGTLIAEYPDFAPGTPVRVLPAIVSNSFPTDGRIIDDAWSFAGPTRHPEYAVIRHDRDHITVTMQRHRLQQRPASRRPAVLSLARVTPTTEDLPMPIIDYALAYDFVDPADTTIPYRLEFQHPHRDGEDPHPRLSDPVGQLRAVVRGSHPQRGTVSVLTRAGVHYNEVQAAIGPWPWHAPHKIDLAQIRARIHAAGLD